MEVRVQFGWAQPNHSPRHSCTDTLTEHTTNHRRPHTAFRRAEAFTAPPSTSTARNGPFTATNTPLGAAPSPSPDRPTPSPRTTGPSPRSTHRFPPRRPVHQIDQARHRAQQPRLPCRDISFHRSESFTPSTNTFTARKRSFNTVKTFLSTPPSTSLVRPTSALRATGPSPPITHLFPARRADHRHSRPDYRELRRKSDFQYLTVAKPQCPRFGHVSEFLDTRLFALGVKSRSHQHLSVGTISACIRCTTDGWVGRSRFINSPGASPTRRQRWRHYARRCSQDHRHAGPGV